MHKPGIVRLTKHLELGVVDPNGQTPLGNDGTVMKNFRWAAPDGAELVARSGALVASHWTFIKVSLGALTLEAGTLGEKRVIEGDGWTLTLPAGWRITQPGGRIEVRPPG